MCDECLNIICPGNCPECDEYSAEFGTHPLRCSLCSSPIYSDDEYICTDNEIFCRECVDSFDAYDILEVSGAADICELLSNLGFSLKKA